MRAALHLHRVCTLRLKRGWRWGEGRGGAGVEVEVGEIAQDRVNEDP